MTKLGSHTTDDCAIVGEDGTQQFNQKNVACSLNSKTFFSPKKCSAQ